MDIAEFAALPPEEIKQRLVENVNSNLIEALISNPSSHLTVSGDIGHKIDDNLGVRVFCDSVNDVIVDEQREELTVVMCTADLNYPLRDLMTDTVKDVINNTIAEHQNEDGGMNTTRMFQKRLNKRLLDGISKRLNQ